MAQVLPPQPGSGRSYRSTGHSQMADPDHRSTGHSQLADLGQRTTSHTQLADLGRRTTSHTQLADLGQRAASHTLASNNSLGRRTTSSAQLVDLGRRAGSGSQQPTLGQRTTSTTQLSSLGQRTTPGGQLGGLGQRTTSTVTLGDLGRRATSSAQLSSLGRRATSTAQLAISGNQSSQGGQSTDELVRSNPTGQLADNRQRTLSTGLNKSLSARSLSDLSRNNSRPQARAFHLDDSGESSDDELSEEESQPASRFNRSQSAIALTGAHRSATPAPRAKAPPKPVRQPEPVRLSPPAEPCPATKAGSGHHSKTKLPRIRRRKHPGLIRSASLSDVPKVEHLGPLTSLSAARAEEEAAKRLGEDPVAPAEQFVPLSRLPSFASLEQWNIPSRPSTPSESSGLCAIGGVILPSLRTIMELSPNEPLEGDLNSPSLEEEEEYDDDSDCEEPERPMRKKRSYRSRIKELRNIRRRRPEDQSSDDSSDEDGPVEPHKAEDDCAILRPDPDRQVDYLAHEWCEEEVSTSWRVIVSKRWYYGERSRLENASWRSWAKHKYGLKTLDPEELNWYRDEDSTQLYGPFLPKPGPPEDAPTSPAPSPCPGKRPILKKRNTSEAMLFDSRPARVSVRSPTPTSSSNLSVPPFPPRRPGLDRRHSDRPASQQSLTPLSALPARVEKVSKPGLAEKHIRFASTVTQCIATAPTSDLDDSVEEADDSPDEPMFDDSEDSDDDRGMVMAYRPINNLRRASTTALPALSNPGTTPAAPQMPPGVMPSIAMLPSTVLRPDTATSRWMTGADRLYGSVPDSIRARAEASLTVKTLADVDAQMAAVGRSLASMSAKSMARETSRRREEEKLARLTGPTDGGSKVSAEPASPAVPVRSPLTPTSPLQRLRGVVDSFWQSSWSK